MVNPKYLAELAEFKISLRESIAAQVDAYIKAAEEEYAADNDSMEGKDYWNEELGMDEDSAIHDFIEWFAIKMDVSING